MKTQLSNRLQTLTPEKLSGLEDEDLFALDRLLKEERYDKLDARCSLAEVDEKGWATTSSGPMYWLRNLTRTIDDHALAKGTPAKAPFPRKTYFLPLMGALLYPVLHPSPKSYSIFVPKSREMMTSWTICGYIGWLCQWRPGTLAVVQTLKETKAEELIRYVAILTENQEPFLQERHRVTRSVALEIEWANGSRMFGIPGGENQIRMFHPFVAVFDEMAFMEDAEACYNAVKPVAKQVIAVSSANPGWFGDMCSA
ncbi:MAG TPA: hypothetical protein VGT24_09465 [Candidatus Acidoferrales bacterium]|nr:hypothetical protein [Candidatus Acidoferrales bacterium]